MAAERMRSLRRLRPKSIRARATATAAAVMTVALTAVGTWTYHLAEAHLLDSTTSRTKLAAHKATAALERGPRLSGDSPSPLPRPVGGIDLVLALDPEGRVVATSDASFPSPELLTDLQPLTTEEGINARTFDSLPGAHGPRSVVAVARTTPDPRSPHVYQCVYALTGLNDLDHALRHLLVARFLGIPLLVALIAAITYFTTGRTLRPIAAIRSELAAVTACELDRRVPEPASGDEVAALAKTVNTTLNRLEHAVTRQREFVADASHELRSPLAAVRSQLELALTPAAGPHWQDSVRGALIDADRLQRITADLLLLARLDAEVAPARKPADLALLAAEEVARRDSAPVRVTMEAIAPVPLHGDPAQLERLLTNLVDNAVRHAVSTVNIRAVHDPSTGHAVWEVVDDGPGIPPPDRQRVFERFTRLDTARDRNVGGTGLGLAIAREIATAHGGTLVLADSSQGARLVARFPT